MKKVRLPTMKDVAKRSGVAESTVSRVIGGTKFVAPETRAAVEQAMRELDFHRDSHARRLARGRSDFLGLIISNIENPFYPGLIKAFETAALEHGFEVLLSTTNYDPARTEQAFRKMVENKCPGVAVMTSRVDPAMAHVLSERGIASVFLDSDGPGPLKSNITLDGTLLLDSENTPVLGLGDTATTDGYHNLSHHGKAEPKLAQLKALDEWHMKLLAQLLADLKSAREDGDTLLDRSMILYGSNLGNAATHSCLNLPTILAGGGFRHGQHLAFDPTRNYPLPNLFVSMLQRMGIEADKFASSTGTMRGLDLV